MAQRTYPRRRACRAIAVLSIAVVIVAGQGCSHPAFVPRSTSDLALPATFMGMSVRSTDRDEAGMPVERDPRWWRHFGSSALDALVEQAMRDSPSIRSAESRLIEATKYLAGQQGASRYPQVDVGASAKREQLNTAAAGLPMIPNPSPFMLYNTNVSVRYDFDFFGAQRHRVEAKRYEAALRRHQADAARLTLVSNIIAAVVREGRLRDEMDVNDAVLRNRRAVGKMLRERHEIGSVAHRETIDGDSDVDRIEAERAALHAELLKIRFQLAAYAGVPSPESLPRFRLDDLQLPQDLPSTVPSGLVRQRPDILAAEARLHIAGELAGIATANLYPRIELGASIGSSPLALGQLFAGGATIWNIGAQLGAPVFRGGELRAARDAAIAAYDATFEDYRTVVLGALQSVADAMTEIDRDAIALQARRAVAQRQRTVLEMTRRQFENGSSDRLHVLRDEYAYDLARLEMIRVRAARMASTVSFFAAVGGDAYRRD
ncbi:efflux transporter outer membrane subunit [Burkholderia seminalis]|uniref:efflux transporter outer membrane subunit n=1 Tax=Burkholderia seminalis TaxID=488731 RepID=UPI0009EAF883|nr:efflux transporter outer membrane subunit [Burkholderia seminalis]MCA8040281.1 efflux transporter outer membrane subunit [Burkholderia seminalis]